MSWRTWERNREQIQMMAVNNIIMNADWYEGWNYNYSKIRNAYRYEFSAKHFAIATWRSISFTSPRVNHIISFVIAIWIEPFAMVIKAWSEFQSILNVIPIEVVLFYQRVHFAIDAGWMQQNYHTQESYHSSWLMSHRSLTNWHIYCTHLKLLHNLSWAMQFTSATWSPNHNEWQQCNAVIWW